jgi:hypothetical protein
MGTRDVVGGLWHPQPGAGMTSSSVQSFRDPRRTGYPGLEGDAKRWPGTWGCPCGLEAIWRWTEPWEPERTSHDDQCLWATAFSGLTFPFLASHSAGGPHARAPGYVPCTRWTEDCHDLGVTKRGSASGSEAQRLGADSTNWGQPSMESLLFFLWWYWGLNSGPQVLYHFSHPFFVLCIFEIGSRFLLGLASNRSPSDLCLLSS